MADQSFESSYDNDEKAVFNMALDTLKRLGETLREVKQLSYKTDYTIETRQAVKIGLIRQFFVQASPLLPTKKVNDYKKEILNFAPAVIDLRQKKSFGNDVSVGTRIVYNSKLDFRLDEILIDLQIILQEKGHFMPDAEDEGAF